TRGQRRMELNAIRCSLNTLLTQNATDEIKFAKQKLIEHGNKPGKCLSYLRKTRIAIQTIASVSNGSGSCSTDPEVINAAFLEFYRNLYQSEQCDNSHWKWRAIRSLQNGKAPGFTSEFYKEFRDLLSKPYLDMLNDSLGTGVLPLSRREANISLILKKTKPPEDCGSYRPISLLNVDLKILSKILTTHLEGILPYVINTDQTGFIKGHDSCNNLKRLLNIIQFCQQHAVNGLEVSLDAEKAFDRVGWSYLIYTTQQFGLGSNFINWIKILYNGPLAAVIPNGLRSKNFEVGRGNRQGCPLSPLLFTLVIEPLAELIRGDSNVFGVNTEQGVHKISLYANECFVVSFQACWVITIISDFSLFSGDKINLSKSEAMPLGKHHLPSSPFKWSPAGFVYLGIFITPCFDQMFKANFVPLLDKIKQDLERWTSLPIGRISLLKMNILPCLLYPMRMIPIVFPHKLIQKIKGWFSSVIWSKKRVLIKMSTLQLPNHMGGLDLPDLKKYQVSSLLV
uniref:Reverse transcriptase domain-containing protein n=1 Tax=Sphaeramia orbicularis TaxID=375764 RepID=A0A672ZMY2_9TELE